MNEYGIKHHFSAGLYLREMQLESEHEVTTHQHAYDHLAILARGSAIVWTDAEWTKYDAPGVINIKAGVSHRIKALTDIVWLCVHATSETDAAKIDEVLIRKAG